MDSSGLSLIDNAYALITSTTRNIGGVIPDCTIEEHHVDETIITDHPVELGAAITDHAFQKPPEVDMKIGFSNSTAQSYGWKQQAYQTLLALQSARQPFNVTTGARSYQNMLVRALTVVTDQTSEFILNIVVNLRGVILVSTQQGGSNGVGTAANQTAPQQTQPVQASGTLSPAPASGIGSFDSLMFGRVSS